MKNEFDRIPVYVIGVNGKVWGLIKTWDLSALNVNRILVQKDLYTLEFTDNDQRGSFEMCMLMNHIDVEDFDLAEYTQLV